MNYFTSSVISNTPLTTQDIWELAIKRNGITPAAGQFFMLKVGEPSLTLMRPISIFKVEEKSLHFLYRVVGKGTRLLSRLKPDEELKLLGPAGNGFPCTQVTGKIALVGGGLGIPPLCEAAKELQQCHILADAYLGYRDNVFALEDFEPYCRQIFVSSEKGPEGYRGFITDLLKPEEYDKVFTCGPEAMMRKVAALCHQAQIPCLCSVERYMACGIGACLGCSIPTANGMKRVCKDGPVFLSTEIFES